MATGSPLYMKDASLTLTLVGPPAGTEAEFNCNVHTAEVVPSPGDETTYVTLCEDGTYTERGATTYVLHIVAAQDWSAGGLAAFLWANPDALATWTYQAHGAASAWGTDTPGMTGTCRLVDPNYGGEADTFAELDVELPIVGRPTLATVAPTIAEASAEAPQPGADSAAA